MLLFFYSLSVLARNFFKSGKGGGGGGGGVDEKLCSTSKQNLAWSRHWTTCSEPTGHTMCPFESLQTNLICIFFLLFCLLTSFFYHCFVRYTFSYTNTAIGWRPKPFCVAFPSVNICLKLLSLTAD